MKREELTEWGKIQYDIMIKYCDVTVTEELMRRTFVFKLTGDRKAFRELTTRLAIKVSWWKWLYYRLLCKKMGLTIKIEEYSNVIE